MKTVLKGIVLLTFIAIVGQCFFEGIIKPSVQLKQSIMNLNNK